MGYMRHHAIIVTSWQKERLIEAHEVAERYFNNVSSIIHSGINGYTSFFVPPDGSKEGWADSDLGDDRRDKFLRWLDEQKYDDGSTHYDWVEVQYGDDEKITKITRHSDEGEGT